MNHQFFNLNNVILGKRVHIAGKEFIVKNIKEVTSDDDTCLWNVQTTHLVIKLNTIGKYQKNTTKEFSIQQLIISKNSCQTSEAY